MKDSLRSSIEAWGHVPVFKSRCLEWDTPLYKQIGASPAVCADPPSIGHPVQFINCVLIIYYTMC